MDETKRCPQCQAELTPNEPFCPSCGHKVLMTAEDYKAKAAEARLKHTQQTYKGRIGSGRTAIMIVAILTFAAGVFLYVKGKMEISKAERTLEIVRNSLTDDEEGLKSREEQINKDDNRLLLFFREEQINKDDNLLLLLFIVNMFMAFLYIGLWYWARNNPFPATLVALLIYLAMWGLSAVLDPASIVQGILIKIAIVALLLNAVTSAFKYRKMMTALAERPSTPPPDGIA